MAWTSDITYLWTDEGWLYLAIVLDLFNREVIGWSLKPRMTSDILTDALTMAWFRRRPSPGCSSVSRIDPVDLTLPPCPGERRDPVVRPLKPQFF